VKCPSCGNECLDGDKFCSKCGARLEQAEAPAFHALDDMIGDYRREIKDHPDNADAFNNLGYALAQQGRWGEAIAAWQRVLELMPEYEPARAAIAQAQQHLEKA